MSNLPDLEGLAIFTRVAEARSFARAATDLNLSKATVSKAVARLEKRLGSRLFHRTSRQISLTDAGRSLLAPASRMLSEAEAAESDASDLAAAPRGLVRLACPMSFGTAYVAPALPDFLATYPEISIDLHLADQVVDLVADGFDLALRIAALPDSSLMARRLCTITRRLVAAPSYLERRERPTHPQHLAEHACLGYAYLPQPQAWRFINREAEEVTVRPAGPLRTNNADALTPSLLAGLGLAVQPDFAIWRELADGRLVAPMLDWSPPPIALHLVSPPGLRPTRVQVLMEFLTQRFARPIWKEPPGPA